MGNSGKWQPDLKTNPPISAKKACVLVHALSSLLSREPSLGLNPSFSISFTDLFADCHCPTASMTRISGPSMPIQARLNLSRSWWRVRSLEEPTLTQRDVQQQRKIVKRHDWTMSKVPLPSGWGTQPSIVSVEFIIIRLGCHRTHLVRHPENIYFAHSDCATWAKTTSRQFHRYAGYNPMQVCPRRHKSVRRHPINSLIRYTAAQAHNNDVPRR